MNKINAEEKMEELRKRNEGKKQKICIPENIKICPFQSSPEEEVPCTHRCALYRAAKQQGYNCPLIELTSIGYALKIQAGLIQNPSRNNKNY
jgi:hypothetical protein